MSNYNLKNPIVHFKVPLSKSIRAFTYNSKGETVNIGMRCKPPIQDEVYPVDFTYFDNYFDRETQVDKLNKINNQILDTIKH